MSFLRRLLGKPPKPQRDPRGINEDWCVGDTAECLAHSWHTPPLIAVPRKGLRYRVTAIVERPGFRNTQVILTGLCLEGFGDLSWCCHCFRKIRATLEPASEEFRAFLRDSLKGPVEVSMHQHHSAPVTLKPDAESWPGRFPAARPAPYSNTGPAVHQGRLPPAAQPHLRKYQAARGTPGVNVAAKDEEWRHLPDPVNLEIEALRRELGWIGDSVDG